MECQYVATQRGGIALLYEGHRYNKVRDGKEGTVYWRCARDRQCPGRAVTVYSRIKKANNKHNHPPDAWRNKVDQVVSDLKLRSQEEITPLPTLFTETLKYLAVNPQMAALATMVPSLSAIKAVERTQNRGMPALVPFRELSPDDEWILSNSASTSEPLDMAMKNTGVLLKRMRALLKNTNYVSDPLQAYIIPCTDAHQSEYLAPCDRRRAFISGFTGTTGTAVITENHASLWTERRYFQQADKQLDNNWTLLKEGLPGTPAIHEWLSRVLPVGSKVGIDPLLISYEDWIELSSKLEVSGHSLHAVSQNLVDLIWDDRPSPPSNIIEPMSLVYTGRSWQEKVIDVRLIMKQKGATALIITALDEVAWLFNLRGSDFDYNPVFLAFGVVTLETVYLFVDEFKITAQVKRHFQEDCFDKIRVEIRPYQLIKEFLSWLVNQQHDKIWISRKSSYALLRLIPEECRIESVNPVLLMKAVKHEVEIECMRRAHVKDAVAMCEFFAWLEDEVASGEVTEYLAALKIEDFRRQQEDYVGPSFEVISATGPNAALIHYHPSEETTRIISSDEFYLCDSGGQYIDGTTDVARTYFFGTPSQYEKECFTRVMKGHIAISSAVFPRHIKGQMLDTLARKSLWEVGLNYMHKTGHGVGAYLTVHEGPTEIDWKTNPDDPGLQEGMILSNEPGYYESGRFGIKIENLVLVKKADTKYNFQDCGFLTFEPLTLIPFQTKLLDTSLLTVEEMDWLDNYHQICRDVVGKALREQGRLSAFQWLMRETQPLG
ncbi:xaa-Pro aminopeptidase 1 [Nephila pilipes]|uniref:Xaa-Pro aminopeptidase 1 n=1 Tax=Nephila pilipes TaxID=299642 RepID=A0A8X6UIG9_NEPPI|nr:xaa-Pro aminopeptidase 1 [Nephila pilipes]